MKLSERSKWVFAILFLLCGVPLLFLDREYPDPAAAHMLAGMASLFLGGLAPCLAWNALESGEITLQHLHSSRTGQPRRFAATVALIFFAGCGTLIAACWFYLHKQPNWQAIALRRYWAEHTNIE